MVQHSIFFLIAMCALAGASPARAIHGGAPASREITAQTIMIVSTRGASCTGTVIARDLVLTAAHCVGPKSNYAVVIPGGGAPRLIQITRIALHPRFDPKQFESRRPSSDMAIVKLAEPLPANYRVAKLSARAGFPPHGEIFTLAGFGFARDGDPRSAGTLRSISLPNIGSTGDSMIRVSARSGIVAGACIGDSGGPAYSGDEVAGVIGWTSIPAGKNCGFTTGVTLVGMQREWIDRAAESLSENSLHGLRK